MSLGSGIHPVAVVTADLDRVDSTFNGFDQPRLYLDI